MNRFLVLATASAALLSLVSTSFGQSTTRDPADDRRTTDQAKAMLAKAVAAVKADKIKALDMLQR